MIKKTICYLAAIDISKDAGIVKKVESTAKALSDNGFVSETYFGSRDGVAGVLQIKRKIQKLDIDLIILRSCGYYSPLLVPALIMKRLSGTKIVIDRPTPAVNKLSEIWGNRSNLRSALIRMALLYLSLPWSDWVAHRVIQYGREHPWFMLGLNNKTVLLGNGIGVAALPSLTQAPKYPDHTLVMIGIAKLSFWHGFDRVIHGIATYVVNRKTQGIIGSQVSFVIVGDGSERFKLESLARDLGIAHLVRFEGHRVGENLQKLFQGTHIAVSSLGLHRLRLKLASPLKAREYASMGLPFVFSHEDPDFPPDTPFVYQVPADDTPINIKHILAWYADLRKNGFSPMQLREYALRKLDFSQKIEVFESLLAEK